MDCSNITDDIAKSDYIGTIQSSLKVLQIPCHWTIDTVIHIIHHTPALDCFDLDGIVTSVQALSQIITALQVPFSILCDDEAELLIASLRHLKHLYLQDSIITEHGANI